MDDDLGDLWDTAPLGPGLQVTHRQGTIVTFDQVTGANTVRVGQTTLTNVPLFGVAEAATLTAGAQVGLMATPRQMYIVGRIVSPLTADYTDAVNRLSNSIESGQVAASESTTSTTYVDLTTVGPTVAVTVKSSELLIVMVSADIISDKAGGVGGGLMTVQIAQTDGTVVYAAGSLSLPILHFMYSDNATHLVGDSIGTTRLGLVSLGAGDYIVTGKYSAESGGGLASFANRNITCIAL